MAAVGTVNPPSVTIAGGFSTGTTQFQPGITGTTTLALGVPATPPGFSTPAAQFRTLPVTVRTPGVSLTTDVMIGKDLQMQGTVLIGEPAPGGGLQITLSSNSGSLRLAANPGDAGQAMIQITVPAGSNSATYYLQALAETGTATYGASATGYADGTGNVIMTRSGVVMGIAPTDLPFVFGLAAGSTADVYVSMAQLNPFDDSYMQRQALRAGLSLNVNFSSTNSGVATLNSVTITGGVDPVVSPITTQLNAVGAGSATVSATQPAGFTAASNGPFAGNPTSSILVGVN
jgi:hypothetical protein